MTHSNEALARLRGVRLDDLTLEQMNSVLGPSSISPNVVSQFEQAALISDALNAQRLYGFGLPIPEASSIFTDSGDPLATITIRPTGTEIWELKALRGLGLGGDATTTLSYEDGSAVLNIRVGDTIAAAGTNYDLNNSISAPIQLTNSLYMTVQETGGAVGLAVFAAYTVVSL